MSAGVIYRAYAVDGALLYIGASMNPISRFSGHASQSEWWAEVANITLEHHPSREVAFALEDVAIAKEKPRYNRRVRRDLMSVEEARAFAEQREREKQAQADRWLAEQKEEERLFWRPGGRVRCDNCKGAAFRLPRGELIAELECPSCGCLTLRLEEKAA